MTDSPSQKPTSPTQIISPLSLSQELTFEAQHQVHQKQHQEVRHGISNLLLQRVPSPPLTPGINSSNANSTAGGSSNSNSSVLNGIGSASAADNIVDQNTTGGNISNLNDKLKSTTTSTSTSTIATPVSAAAATTTAIENDNSSNSSGGSNNSSKSNSSNQLNKNANESATLELLDNITSYLSSSTSSLSSSSNLSVSSSSTLSISSKSSLSVNYNNNNSNNTNNSNISNSSSSSSSNLNINNEIKPTITTTSSSSSSSSLNKPTTIVQQQPQQQTDTNLPFSMDTMDLLDQIVNQSLNTSPFSISANITPEITATIASPTPTPIEISTLSPSPLQSSTRNNNNIFSPSLISNSDISTPPPMTPDRIRAGTNAVTNIHNGGGINRSNSANNISIIASHINSLPTPVGHISKVNKSFIGGSGSDGLTPRTSSPIMSSTRSSMAISTGSSPSLASKPVVVKVNQQTTQDIWKSTLSSAGKEEMIKVCFDEIPGKKLVQRFSIDLTPLEIKTKLLEEVGPEFVPLLDQFELKVLSINATFTNESLPLRRQLVMQACNITRLFPKLQLTLKNQEERRLADSEVVDIKSHIETELEIFNLIGKNHTRFLDASNQEVATFRREMAHYRLVSPAPVNDLAQYIYVLSEPMPLIVPPKITILVMIIPDNVKISKKIDCEPNQSVTDTLLQVFKKYAMVDRVHTKDRTHLDFVLKVTGFREYILSVQQVGSKTIQNHGLKPSGKDGDFVLLDYDYIRQCISKQQPIELTFMDNSILKQQVESNVSFIDKLLDTTDFDSDDEDDQSNIQQDNAEQINPPSPPTLSPTSSTLLPSVSTLGIQQQLASAMGGRRLPITKVNRLFRVKIVGLRNINIQKNEDAKAKFVDRQAYGFIMVELYHGGQLISNPVFTPNVPLSNMDTFNFPDWERDVWVPFNISIRSLPRAARACFTFYVSTEPNTTDINSGGIIPLGWANCQLIDHKGCLRTGPVAFRLWDDGRANPIGTCVDNLSAKTPTILLVEFETYVKPVFFVPHYTDSQPSVTSPVRKMDPTDARRLNSLMQSDPLVVLTPEDKKLIYQSRHIYTSVPKSLAKFLLSVNWVEVDQQLEAYRLLNEWAQLKPVQSLELLDARFADSNVRSYAIRTLNKFTDAEFSDYLLQLTQVLKYEPYHRSDLTAILLQRALSNRSRIGHPFFWFLKAELDTPEIEERYGLLLEGYLRSCGSHRQELAKQDSVINQLLVVANSVKSAHSTADKKKALQDGLSKLKLPDRFQLPLDPRWEAKGLIVEKCRYMDSKKLPLWLVFENAEPYAKPLTVIFKVGDDLRQDILTLQVIRIMDKIWKNAGLDLRLQPYKCVATGDGIGMLEVVLNANTIANINKDAGGTGAILEEKTLVNWLRDCNPNETDYNKAVETFILSCAGYVVATYVLGIGDRHADNIMITKAGHLFHIDFGHFLGNYKKKYGFKRERAPFIFTPQYMAIVGGKDSENFKFFVQTCCLAYNTLRKHTDLFINLFQLMLSTGIPELQHEDDIDYLRNALAPDSSDTEAAKEFTNNIHVALNTKTVLLNDIFHYWNHTSK